MRQKTILVTISALVSIFMTHISTASAQDNIQSPDYKIIASSNGVELRQYAPHLVAEVTVQAGSIDKASNKGFRPLAGYIFGGNTSSDKIAMTAPVTTQAKSTGTKIDMTAPVTTKAAGNGSYVVHFSMPKKWTMDNLPIPNNGDVTLKQIPSQKRLAYRFKGRKTDKKTNAADEAILQYAMTNNLQIISEAISAGYDSPMVPFFMRRWEVMRVVE